MKNYFRQKNNKNTGFTLVETLVSISIFTMSILGLMVVLSQGISDTGYAKKKIGATYLAQEGIEYVRNMRDTYVLYDANSPQNGWDSFNTKLVGALGNSLCALETGCYFDNQDLDYTETSQPITMIRVRACGALGGGLCPPLRYNSGTGKYGYDTLGQDSGFVRTIQVQPGENETKVFSTVSWTQGSGNYSITFSESLFNWLE